jgi:hypothetical protein
MQADAAAAAAVERADRFEREAGLSSERCNLISVLRKDALELHQQIQQARETASVQEDRLSESLAEVASLKAAVKRLAFHEQVKATSAKVCCVPHCQLC